MLKVFIDTNVLLDVLSERQPFVLDSKRIWALAEAGTIAGYVSAVSFTTCWYLMRKHAGRPAAQQSLKSLRDIFTPVDLTAQVLQQALDADSGDFEDAVQYHSAVHAGVQCIITRDSGHFPATPVRILSPAGFLSAHSFE